MRVIVLLVAEFMGNKQQSHFSRRFRSLEIEVVNESEHYALKFGEEGVQKDSFFSSGGILQSFQNKTILPGHSSIAHVANNESKPTGVTGGLRFRIKPIKTRSQGDQ